MPPSPLLTAAPTATRAAKSAARLTAVKLLIAKNIATSPTDAITFLSRLVDQRTAHEQGGTTAPESVSPPPFLRFRRFCRRPEERELATELDVRPVSDSPRTTNTPPRLSPEAGRHKSPQSRVGARSEAGPALALSRRSGGVRGYQSTRGSPRPSRLFWRYSIRAERQKG